MATARSDRRRASSGSSRQRSSANRQRRSSSQQARKPLQGRDTGYRVGSGRRQNNRGINPRIIIAGVVGLLLIIALVFGISSCVKGCSKPEKKTEQKTEQKVNPDDTRVGYGVSPEETAKLSAVLDRNETFAKIAKNAHKISDERLIDLAIAEPEAIDFVAGSIKADGSGTAYGSTVPQGEYPKLYTFDTRWGYIAYADGIVGVTGSGPVALSMASMGLSGNDPMTIAQAVTAVKLDNGTTGMDDSFITNHGGDAGISANTLDASSDGIYEPIAMGEPVIVKLKADSGIGMTNAHWALITQLNSDNSISVYDPTSVTASSHTWSLGAVASRCDAAYSLTAAAGTAGVTTTSTIDSTDGTTDDGSSEESWDDGSYDESAESWDDSQQ